MFESSKALKSATVAFTLAVAVGLAGCSGSGVEIEGPGFHIGGPKKAEAKVPDRAPLLVPPDRARLPQPQSQPQSAVASVQQPNWPVDPDATRTQEAEAAAKKKKDYEDRGKWDKKADIDDFENNLDPLSRRNVGLLDKLFKNSGAENVEDEPEPGY